MPANIMLSAAALAATLAMQIAATPTPVQPPSAAQYYERALEAMQHLPQPNNATYDVHVHVTGLGFMLMRQPDEEAGIGLMMGDRRAKSDATFAAAYRKRDDLTSVQTPQGWGIISSPLFDPTWNGVDDWIRYGLDGRPDDATPPPSPAPAPGGLPVIAAIRVMGVAFYNVTDEGPATCANGDPAHEVHLIALRDPLHHPLTDAAIDERTNRLCFVRFEMHQSVVALGYNATIGLNIADVDGESMVRSGEIDVIVRAVGIAVKRFTLTSAYDHVAFPATLAAAIFPTKPSSR